MVPKSLPHQNLVKLFSETDRSSLFYFKLLKKLNYYTAIIAPLERRVKHYFGATIYCFFFTTSTIIAP
jgi:hypothetical protein